MKNSPMSKIIIIVILIIIIIITIRLYNNKQKKRTCKIVHRKKVKRRISTSTLLRNRKKLWNMKVKIILIMTGAFGTVTKGLLKGLEDLKVEGRVVYSN